MTTRYIDMANAHFPPFDKVDNSGMDYDELHPHPEGRDMSAIPNPKGIPKSGGHRTNDSGLANDHKLASDGGSTGYYELPAHARELRHLISHKAMSKARGDIFKACYRLGEKEGVDILYDLRKMKFFIEDLIEMHERGEHL